MLFFRRLSTHLVANYRVGVLLLAAVLFASATEAALASGPTITSSLSQTGDAGHSFTYQITSSPSASSFTAAGLPKSLSLDANTGAISGTFAAAGTFDVALTAQTSSGNATATLRITVRPPEITTSLATTLYIGSAYNYQINASVQPTGYAATGLPPGVKIDESTGQISGVAELSGNYLVKITAHSAYGDAILQFNLVVVARVNPALPVATFPFFPADPGSTVADPRRPRVYIWTYSALVVIDTESLEVVKTITMPRSVLDLSLSVDGNKLWVAYGYSPMGAFSLYIGSVDLETLSVLPDITVDGFKPVKVREGLAGQLYVMDGAGSVRAVDSVTGTSQPPFAKSPFGFLEISPDRRTLYLGDSDNDAIGSNLSRFDVSGSTPALVQRVKNLGKDGLALAISHKGDYLCFVTVDGGLSVVSGSDLTKVYANIPSVTSGPLAFNADDTQLFQINDSASQITVFDPANGHVLRALDLELKAYHSALLVDATDSYLFLAGQRSVPGPSLVEAYDLGAPPKSSPPKTLLNVSTRLLTQAGDNALIGGFIIKGTEGKRIALRAIGPLLPLNGKLADPVLQLFDSNSALIAENDNWNAHRTDVLKTRLPPADEHEAVLALDLQPGSYTAVVRGVGGTSGVVVVEAYDLSATSDSKLANISSRGNVQAGDNVMIGGFIVGGSDQTTTVVVRAIGPSLGDFGVPNVLTDPMLEVHDGNGVLLAEDDDWRIYQEEALVQTGLAPANDRESAMLLVLQPGAYTAIVRGKNNGTGVGLVEVYNLDAN